MNIYHSYQEFKSDTSTFVTIGTFDGVHIGHKEILKSLIETSKRANGASVLLTFFPHPRMVLQKNNPISLLNTINERISLLEDIGLDNLIIEPFTKEFSRLSALDFTRTILVEHLKIKKLVIGYDHRFGRNREGSFEQLQKYGLTYDFVVEEIPAKDIESIAISSTKIREALKMGEIQKANSYLGYSYNISGKVIEGKALGRTFNYPTINIDLDEDYKLIPKSGVYIVKTKIKNIHYYGIMNIGVRPTIGDNYKTIEVHLLDFNANLYGKNITVRLLKRLRDEQKFESLEALFSQIKKDELEARRLIKNGTISF